MSKALRGALMGLRLTWLVQIVLGLLLWVGTAPVLVPIHMLIGLLFVLALWAVAALGLRAGAPGGLAALAAVWGVLVLALGLTQAQLLPGAAHWLIQVIHLVTGIAGIAFGESIARRARPARTASAVPTVPGRAESRGPADD